MKSKWELKVKPNLTKIYEWCQEGLSIEQICGKLNIAHTTFYKYRDQYPELKELLENSKQNLRLKLGKTLIQEALGGYPITEIIEEYKTYKKEDGTLGEKKIGYKKVIKIARPVPGLLQFALCNMFNDEFKRLDKEEVVTKAVEIIDDLK